MRYTSFASASLGILAAASAACSDGATSEPAPTASTAALACAPEWPERVTVSAGGRVTLPVTAAGLRADDAALEPSGVTLVQVGDRVALRAPAELRDGTPASLTVRCAATARTIAVELRALAFQKLAGWEETTGAPAREYGAFWLDEESSGGLVVFGGYHYVPKQFTPSNDAWRFDFATNAWSPLASAGAPTRPGARAARIPGERAVYLVGGAVDTPDGALATAPSMFRVEHDGTTLRTSAVSAPGRAPASYTGALLHDTRRNRWLSVCGLDTSALVQDCAVTAFVPDAGFVPVETTGEGPGLRWGFHYAYDDETDRVIVFGGQTGPANGDIAGDTWALELGEPKARWVRLFADGSGPTKRRNGAYVLDPVGHRLFVWGGTPDGRNSVAGIQALALDQGAEAWIDVPAPPELPARTSGLAIADPARGRLVLGFGNGKAIYRDLWSLDVANAPTGP